MNMPEDNNEHHIEKRSSKHQNEDSSPYSKQNRVLTSMFKSNLSRYDFIQSNINDPGKYSPSKQEKKSHLVNF
jgi:hypothetical protein